MRAGSTTPAAACRFKSSSGCFRNTRSSFSRLEATPQRKFAAGVLLLQIHSTKSMFNKWLFYGIGTMFSMAVLNFMVTVAMEAVKAVKAVTEAFAAQALTAMATGSSVQPISSLALQQGGLGMVLTVLLIVIPPMAANFFGGTLGHFMHYSVFGGGAAVAPSASGPAGAPAPRNAVAEGQATQDTYTGRTYDSPNPGAQVNGLNAGSSIAKEEVVTRKGPAG